MKIISKNLLGTENKFLNLYDYSYEHNGKTGHWYCANRPKQNAAVVIVPIVREHWYSQPKLLIIKEFRIPIENYEYSFPAGLIDGDESIEHTAIRELFEETGYAVTKVISTSPFVCNTPGLTNECIAYAFVECKKHIKGKRLDSTEDIEEMILDRKQIRNLITRAQQDPDFIIGAKAWLIFNLFANTGHIKNMS